MHGSTEGGTKGRVLLVEDHADTLALLRRALLWEGYDVVAASGFEDALRLGSRPGFDALVCDIQLHDGCGWALLGRLKESNPNMSAVALTGHGFRHHLERSREVGYREHLVKPIDLRQLREALGRCTGRAPAIA
jgi:CheY-like chemotaxis protein